MFSYSVFKVRAERVNTLETESETILIIFLVTILLVWLLLPLLGGHTK